MGAEGPPTKLANDPRWQTIASDINALVTFFDLIVLHDKLPAFDYAATFPFPRLAQLVNDPAGSKIIHHIHVSPPVYAPTQKSAVEHLQDRMTASPFVSAEVAQAIPTFLEEIGWEWTTDIQALEPLLPDDQSQMAARFLVGYLLFSGYSQMSGLPHVLSARRSRLIAQAGLPTDQSFKTGESDVWRQVARRLEGEPGWRDEELPWVPSFLPYLLEGFNVYEQGPDQLLKKALQLRGKRSIRKYQKLRTDFLGYEDEDAAAIREARRELAKAADEVARELDSNREQLEYMRAIVVGASPKALGVLTGAGVGVMIGGPPGAVVGAIGGGLAAVVTEEATKPLTERLWGWVIDRLPFVSSRKMLSRAVKAEQSMADQLGGKLGKIWQTGRRDA
jgi:hypothetical protein